MQQDLNGQNCLVVDQMAKLVLGLANFVGKTNELQDSQKNKISKLLTKAVTPALLKQVIDLVWKDFDADENGVLDIQEARKFVDYILSSMYGQTKTNLAKFEAWFSQFDTDHSGSIEKKELE